MNRWKDSLPEPSGHGAHWHLGLALSAIAVALYDGRLQGMQIDKAAAEIRAWRKSLPKDEQGERVEPRLDLSGRALLRETVRLLMYADAVAPHRATGQTLREAEANLRELWQRHQ